MRKFIVAFALLSATLPVFSIANTTIKRQNNIWLIENKHLRVTVNPMLGSITVYDKIAGYTWRQPKANADGAPADLEPKFRRLRSLPGSPGGIAFEADFGTTQGRPNILKVSLVVLNGSGDLVIDTDMRDRNAEITDLPFLDPFILDTAKPVLAIADYANGHLYPLDLKPSPHAYFGADRLDMPWVGVCDLDQGIGYALILETSDDAAVRCDPHPVGGRKVAAPQVVWIPSQGKFAYPRRIIYHFSPNGGYVALAKAYRTYAKAKGLIVPFAEKIKKNPNIHRLFGAPDVWGDVSLSFAQEAKAAGVDKMLIHGRVSPQEMKAINALGYLTSEYDNYADILQSDQVVLQADGQRMPAWLTWDKKTQFMKRCPTFWVPSAKLVIPQLLKTHPFLGRFIDVTTAEGLYECYDEKHPLTRAQKRQHGVDLLGFVRSQGLVVGGEHGIWWGVPVLDYIEGMMSGGYYAWPAGHLIHPKTKGEAFTTPWGGKVGEWAAYERWGIGHAWRAPLWELVFHDCVVSTWYWGDSSDFLLQAAPEVTPKKDALNILYGTIPLLWTNREGSWYQARDLFLRTYRNTSKLHEVIAGTEMLSHEFITPDRAVQRTRFSDGTHVLVNFGERPYTADLGGRKYLLPQNGFAVKGPRIEQSLVLVEGKPVTTIRQQGYFFTDAGGVEVTVKAIGDDQLRVHLGSPTGHGRPASGYPAAPVTFRPTEVLPQWDMASTRMFVLDTRGQRARHVEYRRSGQDRLSIGPFAEATVLDVMCRSQARLPDLRFDRLGVAINPPHPKQGEKVNASVVLYNGGGSMASGVEVALYVDAIQSDRKLASWTVSIAAGQQKTVSVNLDTSPMDGSHRLIVVADPEHKVAELCVRNNDLSRAIEVMPDLSHWQHRQRLRVEAGDLDREDEPVVFPMELTNVNPASVRVLECDEQGHPQGQVPAQFDILHGGGGELCLLLRGKTPARTARHFLVLWAERAKGHTFLPPPATMWNGLEKTVTGETYRAEFDHGTLTQIAAVRDGTVGNPFISILMLSSKETGWIEEPGTVERFDVLHGGPVRTTILVRKALSAGVVYEKTYSFYPRRFDVTISVNKPAGGLYSRAYYLQPGEYVNDQGFRAKVDGQGEAENVYGQGKNPRWYAVYGDNWAHACLALSPFSYIAYWDSEYKGGIGFVTSATQDIRISYVVHASTRDATFAENNYRRMTSPAKVVME